MAKTSVVHVVPGLHPKEGGPSRTVVQLCDALARRSEFEITLLSQGLMGGVFVSSTEPGVIQCVVESPSGMALQFGRPIQRWLNTSLHRRLPALVHVHGIWHLVDHWGTQFACKHGIRLIIQPRGMLEPQALEYKAWKKRVAMLLFQRRDLESAKLMIATSSREYENIRKFGFRNPIAVIPNGVGLVTPTVENGLTERYYQKGRTVLFLSRIHPKKGLANLVRAWSQIQPMGWRLCIAGPDERGHFAEVNALARELGVATSLDYVGEVDGLSKSALYNSADVFVLPTFSENFGVVVAEALAHGLPVITTKGAPWGDLPIYGCGWWVDIGVEPLVAALREAMALSDEERRAMGTRGRDYVRRYNWGDIARQMAEVYLWVIGQGPRPDCVQLD